MHAQRHLTVRGLSVIALFFAGALFGSAVCAQAYPARPVRVIVPVSPGATTDTLARAVAQELSTSLGQQFVIENRPGASGIIGTELVSKATPDGYTLLVITSTHTINPSLHQKLPYDPIRDFSAISLMASTPTVLIVHPSLPVSNVRDFVRLAKASAGGLNFGSGGKGSSTHLVAELFQSSTGLRLNHIPYKGAGPALTDVVTGQIHFMFSGVVPALPHIQSGRVRALGVTSLNRSSALPAVPSLSEGGLHGFEFGLWYAVLGPAALPPAVVTKLNSEIRKALQVNSIRNRLMAEGGEVNTTTPEQLVEHMRKEIRKYEGVVRSAGIKGEES
ncbi:MAG: Bug family tripartite tricarboxylate transporter substrate binding protein [Burkholderiales bacterium]